LILLAIGDNFSENPYGSLFDWYQLLGVQNKQGEIRVEDAQEILKSLALKSYEGGYKIMIIWMAEKMNISASNKLLKLLEEPTDKTMFILISENEEDIIQTIRSRCQVLHFNALPEKVIAEALISYKNIEPRTASKLAHQAQGNYNKVLQLLQENSEDHFLKNILSIGFERLLELKEMRLQFKI
jgi:DNA polymerase-3 subunit delta'